MGRKLLGTHGKNTNHASERKRIIVLSQGLCVRLSMQCEWRCLTDTVQVLQGDTGKGIVSSEFVSMSTMYDIVPDITTKPIAWGTYASNPNIHFLLCIFHEMTNEVPDVEVFPAKIAELHMKGVSPNGKFGFPVINYSGRLPQSTIWCDTWEESFSRILKHTLELEEEAQGYSEEMRRLADAVITKVIPRLLRPLETEGRQIQPRLVHGDLWDGNVRKDATTNSLIIFDAAAIYAHNECKSNPEEISDFAKRTDELAPWRPTRHKIGKLHMDAYNKHFPISEPKEDFDDRIALYCM
jgi:protein-ribulosamine 3-kinase